MRLADRIARVKQVDFVDAMAAVDPSLDLSGLPKHVECPLPDHLDSDPSCYLQVTRWHCFGCGRGGDVLDFVQHYHDCRFLEAVEIVERALGFSDLPEDELAALARAARRVDPGDAPPTNAEWQRALSSIEDRFLRDLRPFLRCVDPVVLDLAWPRAEYVFAEVDEERGGVPRTTRRMRETLRRLDSWVQRWARGIGLDVERVTGKDRLDVAGQSVRDVGAFGLRVPNSVDPTEKLV